MKKTLSVLFASLLSFGISLPVLAGTTPVTVTPTSNSTVGSGGTNTELRNINIPSIPPVINLSSSDLTTSPPGQGLITSLTGAGVSSELAGDLIKSLILALAPARNNGEISVSADGTVLVKNSSLTVNEAAFNQAIADFNAIISPIQGDSDDSKRKRDALLKNDVFMAISAFLRSK